MVGKGVKGVWVRMGNMLETASVNEHQHIEEFWVSLLIVLLWRDNNQIENFKSLEVCPFMY